MRYRGKLMGGCSLYLDFRSHEDRVDVMWLGG
jgi:hypothetical protein